MRAAVIKLLIQGQLLRVGPNRNIKNLNGRVPGPAGTKYTRAITLQASPVSASTRKSSNQLEEEWNHETTQYSLSASLLRVLGVHTIGVHIIRADAKVPATETDGKGKTVTPYPQAGEAIVSDSEFRGAKAASDQERPIALQG